MSKLKIACASLFTLGLLVTAAPAEAQSASVTDASGDTFVAGLDITSATLANHDQAFVANISFVVDKPDRVVVAIENRAGRRLRVVSEHPLQGEDTTTLLDEQGNAVRCRGLRGAWDRAAATLALRVPSSCLIGGNYGAVRSWVLTESRSGHDVDYAPQTADGDIAFTPWIPRG